MHAAQTAHKHAIVAMPLPFKELKTADFRQAYRKMLVYARHNAPQANEIINDVKDYFSYIWLNRGYFAIVEVFSHRHKIDWEFIAEVLNLNKATLNNQIQQAVQKYTQGHPLHDYELPDYADLLAIVDSLPIQTNSSGDMMTSAITGSSLSWATKNLYTFIAGEKNPKILRDSHLQQVARTKVANHYLNRQTTQRTELFKKEYLQAVQKAQLTPENAVEQLSILARNLVSKYAINVSVKEKDYHPLLVELVPQLPTTLEIKRLWLDALLLYEIPLPQAATDVAPERKFTWLTLGKTNAEKHVKIMIDHGVVQSAIDFWIRFRKHPAFIKGQPPYLRSNYSLYFNDISALINEELEHINGKDISFEQLMIMTDFLKQPIKDQNKTQLPASLRQTRNLLVRIAEQMPLTLHQKYVFFYQLTESGATLETDHYLKTYLLANIDSNNPSLAGTEGSSALRHIETLLKTERISSHGLTLSLAKKVFEPRIQSLEKQKNISRDEIYKMINELHSYVKNGSIEKDRFIESLAWRLRQKGAELVGLIEDQKSLNWQAANPFLVNMGSLISNEIAQMSVERRTDFLHYLIDPAKTQQGIPQSVQREIENQLFAALLKPASDPIAVREEAREKALLVKYQIESFLIDSTPTERIPLIEVVLTSGTNALMKQHDWPHNLTRKPFLGYDPGSIQELMLEAYLEIIPEHETSVSMAYMLSQSGTQKSSIADIFELFGTVGIKFGQLASVWEIFGPEIAAETKHLKDRATALTKHKFLRHLQKHQIALFHQIDDVEQILGSASIKTVALVKMKTGEYKVLALRPPNIEAKIASNIKLGEAFIAKLEKFNLQKKSSLLKLLIEALREQLKEEVQLNLEANKIERARAVYSRLNSDLKTDMNGWQFEVPKIDRELPVKDMVFTMEQAHGVPFDQLPADVQKQVGPLLVKSSLAGLFRYGVFDPDRHKGNWLFDVKTKKIWCLDFGQLEDFSASGKPWKWEPRLTLAEFTKAFESGDANRVVHFGSLMANQDKEIAINKSEMLTNINKVFAIRAKTIKDIHANKNLSEDEKNKQLSAAMSDALIGVVTELAEGGIPLERRFLFGALKGLMVLYGENYIQPDQFNTILRKELQKLSLIKLPALVMGQKSRVIDQQLKCEEFFIGLKN